MSIEILREDIKKGEFGQIYVFYGEEAYLRNYYREQLVKKGIKDQFPEFNLHIFDSASFSLPEFMAAVEGYPCFSDCKIVVVKNLLPAKYNAILSQMQQALHDMPATNTVIFDYDETIDPMKKCTELRDMLKKEKGLFVSFSTPKESELATWVKRHFTAHKKVIDSKEVYYLLSICDNAMTNLYNEIEKICRFCSVDTILRYHIDQMASPSLDTQVFELTNGLTERNSQQVFFVLNRLLQDKEEPVMILGAINNMFIRLLKIKAATLSKMTKQQMMELSGIKNDYVLKRTQQSAQQLEYGYLQYALRQCRTCDELLKGSRIDDKLALEILIGKLLNKGNGAGMKYA